MESVTRQRERLITILHIRIHYNLFILRLQLACIRVYHLSSIRTTFICKSVEMKRLYFTKWFKIIIALPSKQNEMFVFFFFSSSQATVSTQWTMSNRPIKLMKNKTFKIYVNCDLGVSTQSMVIILLYRRWISRSHTYVSTHIASKLVDAQAH